MWGAGKQSQWEYRRWAWNICINCIDGVVLSSHVVLHFYKMLPLGKPSKRYRALCVISWNILRIYNSLKLQIYLMFNHHQLSLPTEMPRAIISHTKAGWIGQAHFAVPKGRARRRQGPLARVRVPGQAVLVHNCSFSNGSSPELSPTLSSEGGVRPKTCISSKFAGAAAGTTV